MRIEKIILFVLILISIMVITACNDPLEIEQQDNEVITPDEIRITNSSDIFVSPTKNITKPKDNENNSNTSSQDIQTYSDADSFKERDKPARTYKVIIDGLDENTTKVKTIALHDIVDIYLDENIISKITATNIPNSQDIWISVNEKSPQKYQKDDKIELKDSYYLEIGDIMYNDDEEKYVSMIEIKFIYEKKEKYPQYLIEQDIGLHEYVNSQKITNKYVANYDDVTVEVKKEKDFVEKYSDSRKVMELKGMDIYRLEKGVVWPTEIEKIPYVVYVNNDMEEVIFAYAKRFPSYIGKDTFCGKRISIEERETKSVKIGDKVIAVEAIAILDSTMEVKLQIDGKLSTKKSLKDIYELDSDNTLIIDSIHINYDGNKDKVEICIV